MKKLTLFFTLIIICQTVAYAQKKYEMVIEKTDGTSIAIKTEDITKTYFREITSSGDSQQGDFNLVGTWCYGSSEEDALGDMNNIEGYVFKSDGTCTYFAIYNQGKSRETRTGTYTYANGVLTIVTNKTSRYNVSISGNCMTWTGDDNETLYTREGFSVDLGDENNGGGSASASAEGVWYMKSEEWYDCNNGQPDLTQSPYKKTYEDYSTKYVWEFIKSGSDYTIQESRDGRVRDSWSLVSTNEYRNHEGTGRDLVKIKSVGEKTLVIELFDGYYGEGNETNKTAEYGILTFMR